MIQKIIGFCVAGMIVAILSVPIEAQTVPHEDLVIEPMATEAISFPSHDVTLSFLRAGEVSDVLVKVGDAVKKDQLLVRKDEEVERIQMMQLKAKAKNVTRIKAAEANLAQKKVELQKLHWAAKRGAATELEVENARLEVLIQELSLDLARFEHQQDTLKYEEAVAQLERMRLRSPIQGTVEAVEVEPGESIDALKEVVRIVDTRTLWIDAAVGLPVARKLKVGQAAEVIFPGDDRIATQAKVVHIASVADAASNTLKVRVEMENPSGRPAGEHVRVRFLSDAEKSETK